MASTHNYFGTNLDRAGHYFWRLEGERISNLNLNFKDFPFDPEELTKKIPIKGTTLFYWIGGYSICAIVGSCADDRNGTKSVFFFKEDLSIKELIDKITSIPIAKEIIDKMPFPVYF